MYRQLIPQLVPHFLYLIGTLCFLGGTILNLIRELRP